MPSNHAYRRYTPHHYAEVRVICVCVYSSHLLTSKGLQIAFKARTINAEALIQSAKIQATVTTTQGRRNGGGGGAKHFVRLSLFHIKRIQFCTLVYLWFPLSTDIAIHLFICRCFLTLKFVWLAKHCPPPCSCCHATTITTTTITSTTTNILILIEWCSSFSFLF